MKLLFVLDTVDYPTGVNAQLARRLADQLAQMGHTVHLLELWDGHSPPPQPARCTLYALPFADERAMNQALEHGAAQGSPIPVRLARLAAHPTAALAAVRMVALKKPRRQAACQKKLEQLDAAHHYDAVVAVAAPYYAAFALAHAAIKGKKAVWQMDPYTANRQARQNGGALARELHLYAAVQRMFITELMRADYQADPFAPFAAKAQVLDFPCLVPPLPVQGPPTPPARPLRCVFTGNLYPGVRTPHFALQLFGALEMPQVQLVFVGGGWQQFPGLAQRAQARLGGRLVLAGPMPPEEARAQMAGADVLVNLGNGVANQLPSKIFEYFGTGKPVLNLAKLPQDPALPYFARYPLACTVLEQEGCGPTVCTRVRQFLQEAAGQQLPFAQVQALFPQNTPQAVAQQLLAGLE